MSARGIRRSPHGLPACARVETRQGGRAVRLCGCVRCAALRYRAVRIFGTESEHIAAIVTRAVAENA